MQNSHSIRSVLIANRGEIAQRIQATCHARGIATIAVFAPQDATSKFVYSATHAYALSGDGAAAYLDQTELITIAKQAGADAVHPGYGFLAERADFAQRVIDAGLCWIGPTPQTIAAMGDKAAACSLMRAHGVPTIPGTVLKATADDSIEQITAFGAAHGFPLLLKDPLGGGGKGIWLIKSKEEISSIVPRARAALLHSRPEEACTIVVERYLAQARHIEVQIAGDGTKVAHLFERECSLQRRHQKIIEEAPAVFVNQNVRQALHQAAIQAAQAVHYNNIGTVEFLVEPNGNFYFLEMNTRLQVEHSVTEMTTGIDLVGLQLDIAQTGTVPPYVDNLTQTGHAVECRIYAEDPTHNFLPSTGSLRYVALPALPWTRVDADIATGDVISGAFDPMIAKITTWGNNRLEAINRMQTALHQTDLHGITTNGAFLQALLRWQPVIDGKMHTQLLNDARALEHLNTQPLVSNAHDELIAATAALYAMQQNKPAAPSEKTGSNAWKEQQWR